MTNRVRGIFAIILIFFLLIVLRLFYWQVIKSEELKGIAEKQLSSSFGIPAKRGEIFSRDGGALVLNQKAFLLYGEPEKIKNFKVTVEILAKELMIAESTIAGKLSQKDMKWVSVDEKVDESIVVNLKKYDLPGLGFTPQFKRYYPESSMAAHVLGFVGKNVKGEDQGYFGIEGYYDEQLKGRNGVVKQDEDALGNPILGGKISKIDVQDGRDLSLTLDKTVQFIAESKLKTGIEKYQAKGGTVTVINPNTGEILAMAAYPSYFPGKYNLYPGEYYKNPVVSSSYEPGSTFKVLIMAAALNENKITPQTKFNEEGPVKIEDYNINTWNFKYHGIIDMTQVLEYSSNVGMVFVGKKMGPDLLLDYINKLGFGDKSEIDLEEEASPKLRERGRWYPIDYATTAFGQGIAVTPLQMVRAVAAIANGGKLMRPYMVKSIHEGNGKIINISPKIERVVYRREATRQIIDMMTRAVDNGETKNLKPKGYKIAGKTGTAQIPIAGHYDSSKTIASFVGMAPVESPKFVMLVTVSEPTTSPWGSETAAPIFFEIAKELFSYYKISPGS